MTASDDADEAVRLEEELMLTSTRQDPARLRALLDDDFLEFGQSGTRWDRERVIAALVESDVPLDGSLDHAEGALLAPGVLLLTFEAEVEGHRSLRSSIWLRGEEGWRLRFHQGTRIPGPAAGAD